MQYPIYAEFHENSESAIRIITVAPNLELFVKNWFWFLLTQEIF